MPGNKRDKMARVMGFFAPPKGTLEASPMPMHQPMYAPGDLENIPDKRAFIESMPLGSTVTYQGAPYSTYTPPMRKDLPPEALSMALAMRKKHSPVSVKPVK